MRAAQEADKMANLELTGGVWTAGMNGDIRTFSPEGFESPASNPFSDPREA